MRHIRLKASQIERLGGHLEVNDTGKGELTVDLAIPEVDISVIIVADELRKCGLTPSEIEFSVSGLIDNLNVIKVGQFLNQL